MLTVAGFHLKKFPGGFRTQISIPLKHTNDIFKAIICFVRLFQIAAITRNGAPNGAILSSLIVPR